MLVDPVLVDPAHCGVLKKAGLWSAFFMAAAFWASPGLATDRPFASIARTFGDLVDYDRNLIETESVPLALGQPADALCLVTAVRLKPDATEQPPRRDRSRPLYAQFGGAWKSTPMAIKGPKGKDILAICGPFLRVDGFSALNALGLDRMTLSGFDNALLNALETPGSYYIKDWTGSLLQVYSARYRLAVSIRLAERKAGR